MVAALQTALRLARRYQSGGGADDDDRPPSTDPIGPVISHRPVLGIGVGPGFVPAGGGPTSAITPGAAPLEGTVIPPSSPNVARAITRANAWMQERAQREPQPALERNIQIMLRGGPMAEAMATHTLNTFQPHPSEALPPPAPVEPTPAESAQVIADRLTQTHGDDHLAIHNKLNDLARNSGQEAADAVWDKLPEDTRWELLGIGHAEAVGLRPPAVQEPQRQPGASRTGYVSPYGIYGQHTEPSDDIPTSEEEYYQQLSPFEGETYEGIPREQHPFNTLSTDAWGAYQKYIQPRLGNIRDFAKKFFGGYDTRGINVEAGEHPEYGEGSTSFDGFLTDKGNHVASISASINPATNSAHLGLLEIEPPYRGTAGPRLLRNQIDMYQQLGLDYVDLLAAGGGDPFGGSYAWAKYGFVPPKQEWDTIRAQLMTHIGESQYTPADQETIPILRNILSNSDPRSIWRLSDFTAANAAGQPVGKEMLVYAARGPSRYIAGWHGSLNFKDTDAMRRFDAYISRPKKPKADR